MRFVYLICVVMAVEMLTKTEVDLAFKKLFEQLSGLKDGQNEILGRLDEMKGGEKTIVPEYMPAIDFMKAVGIKRWKFDQLIAGNMIKTIKKKRKIYVPQAEVKRYFLDPDIQ